MEESILDQEFIPKKIVPASKKKRFLGFIIDMIAYFSFSAILGVVLALSGFESILYNVNDTVFGVILITSYYMLTEGITGRSIGKIITKTKVLNEKDEMPTFLNMFGRTLCRLIPFDALSFLGGGYGWHDSVSKTKVVDI